MPSIEDMTEGPSLNYEMVPIADIEFDPENPNELTDEMYEALTTEIRDHGFTQPVALWRREDGTLRMIDGEHRTRILDDLGAAKVPAVIIEAIDEDEARLRLLTMNRLRGQFIPIKLAQMLADLATRIDEKALRKRLGMEPGELKDHLRMASFTDPVTESLRVAVAKERAEAPTVLKFVVANRKDADAIERVIDSLVEGGTDRGKALTAVCRAYEKQVKAA
jgi:ParB/RepB/Spo0J family partition protein